MSRPVPAWSGKKRLLARLFGAGAVAMILATTLAGCWSNGDLAGLVSYWALNDSDAPAIIEVHGPQHLSLVLPPHAYAAIVTGEPTSASNWSIGLVDAHCVSRQSWPVNTEADLLYVGPTGDAQFTTGLAWDFGLRTAKEAPMSPLTPACLLGFRFDQRLRTWKTPR